MMLYAIRVLVAKAVALVWMFWPVGVIALSMHRHVHGIGNPALIVVECAGVVVVAACAYADVPNVRRALVTPLLRKEA